MLSNSTARASSGRPITSSLRSTYRGSRWRLSARPQNRSGVGDAAGAALVDQNAGRIGTVGERLRHEPGGPPTASPSNRRMPEPNTGDRNSHGSRVVVSCRCDE
jgi:hypothetical protein